MAFYRMKTSSLALEPTQPLIQLSLRANLPGVKLQVHEADLPSATSIEFKNEWIYNSVLLVCLHVLHKDSFTY